MFPAPSTNVGRNRPADTSPFCCRKGRPMLQLINIEKKYTTGDLTQAALNGVSLNLRDSEFVAILGPAARARPRCCGFSWAGGPGQRYIIRYRCPLERRFQEDRLLEGYDVLTNLRFVCRQRLSDAELFCLRCSLLPQNALFQPVCDFRRHEAPIVFAARPARSLRPF